MYNKRLYRGKIQRDACLSSVESITSIANSHRSTRHNSTVELSHDGRCQLAVFIFCCLFSVCFVCICMFVCFFFLPRMVNKEEYNSELLLAVTRGLRCYNHQYTTTTTVKAASLISDPGACWRRRRRPLISLQIFIILYSRNAVHASNENDTRG